MPLSVQPAILRVVAVHIHWCTPSPLLGCKVGRGAAVVHRAAPALAGLQPQGAVDGTMRLNTQAAANVTAANGYCREH